MRISEESPENQALSQFSESIPHLTPSLNYFVYVGLNRMNGNSKQPINQRVRTDSLGMHECLCNPKRPITL